MKYMGALSFAHFHMLGILIFDNDNNNNDTKFDKMTKHYSYNNY